MTQSADEPSSVAVDGAKALAVLALLLLAGKSQAGAFVTAVVLLVWAVKDPIVALTATIAAAALSPAVLPPLGALQQFSIRWQDVALAALLTALTLRWTLVGRPPSASGPVHLMVLSVAIFISYVGLTLCRVYLAAPERVPAAIASHARLVQSALMAPLILVVLSDRRMVGRLSRQLLVVGAAVVLLAATDLHASHLIDERARVHGFLSTGSAGLIAAMLCLAATIGFAERQLSPQVALAVLGAGAVGLLVSKSAISAVAFGLAASLYVVFRLRRNLLSPLLVTCVVGAAVIGGLVTIRLLRPSDFDGLVNLTGGSFTHRLLIVASGLWLMPESPLIGLGWQMSLSPDLLRDPALSSSMWTWFPAVPRHYLPDVRPTSLHNLYLQTAVEFGAVGLCAFALMAGSVAQVARQALRLTRDVWSVYYAYALVLLMVWWNSSALWGGQIESVLGFSFVGIVGVLARQNRPSEEWASRR
jgi:O-antigen ligase